MVPDRVLAHAELFRDFSCRGAGDKRLEQLGVQGHRQLRLGHVAVLSNLDLSGGTRLVVIAERAGVTKQAIGPVARALESMSYVSTAADPSDRRAKLVSLAAAGRQVIEHAQPIIDRIESDVRNNLGPAGFERLVELLNNLLDDCDEGDAYPNDEPPPSPYRGSHDRLVPVRQRDQLAERRELPYTVS